MKFKHGKSHNVGKKSVLYNRYNAMKNSCYNSKVNTYKTNGGRGIIVCDLWKNDFMEFYNWAITNGFTNKRSLIRIDRNKEFSPYNCKWVSKRNKNKITNKNRPPCNKIKVKYNGQIYSLNELSSLLDIPYMTLYFRLSHTKLSGKIVNYEDKIIRKKIDTSENITFKKIGSFDEFKKDIIKQSRNNKTKKGKKNT